MARSALAIVAVAIAAVAIASTGIGCAVGGAKGDPEEIEFVEGEPAFDGFTRALRLRGVIGFGRSIESEYAGVDGYAGWVWSGVAGTTVRIGARAAGRTDPVLYLYGPLRRGTWASAPRIAASDDADAALGTDSEIEIELRASGIYLIVVREHYDRAGAFDLSLACAGGECQVACEPGGACPDGAVCPREPCSGAGCRSYCEAPPPSARCLVDDDCVPVPTTCCPCSVGGEEIAVHVDHSAESLPVCDRAMPPTCGDTFLCDRRAVCVSQHCEMVGG